MEIKYQIFWRFSEKEKKKETFVDRRIAKILLHHPLLISELGSKVRVEDLLKDKLGRTHSSKKIKRHYREITQEEVDNLIRI